MFGRGGLPLRGRGDDVRWPDAEDTKSRCRSTREVREELARLPRLLRDGDRGRLDPEADTDC